MSRNDAIGEVMASSMCEFLVQTWADETHRPEFGSFLRADLEGDESVFGVVFDVVTGAADNQHLPVPLKLTKRELKDKQPQVFQLLKTELKVVVCGFSRDKSMHARLPGQPPAVHDFVYRATDGEVEELTRDYEYLRLLARVHSVPSEEILSASIRHAARSRKDSYDYLVGAGRQLSMIFREDYDKLVSTLKNIKPDSRPRQDARRT